MQVLIRAAAAEPRVIMQPGRIVQTYGWNFLQIILLVQSLLIIILFRVKTAPLVFFCHEFAHDLGLPDEYDTKHSGLGEPVGFYSLMSNGSWLGKPFGTKPAPISPWGRIELGKIHGGQWVQPTIIQLEDIPLLGKSYQIAQSTSYYPKFDQVVQVNLPKHKLELVPPL